MKLPRNYSNSISFIGTIIAAISLLLIIFFFIITFFFGAGGSYLGLFIYIILPVFLIMGLLLIPIGMWIDIRRTRGDNEILQRKRLIINFNDRGHRNGFLIFLMVTTLFLLLTSVGSYEAFNYTESVEFCSMCHEVMDPEAIAYHNSPHASVSCVECHVGPGADWYVRSKLSGLYQVYSVLFNKYPTPIPTPIHDLRPAKETCLECHWPEKFYAHKLAYEKHYLADSANTEWNINLRMKIGASHSSKGLTEGIHWHINKDIKVEYIASSHDREYIPWVRYVNLVTGDTTIYNDTEDPIDEELLATETPRSMDCMDCHNRPSHEFRTPQDFIDLAIAEGRISTMLPEIKLITMEILYEVYPTKDTAMLVIENRINGFYEENYPVVFAEQKDMIAEAIEGIQTSFKKNMFPEMKATWDAYPDHIGHIEYNGCFRCHSDTHESDQGTVISKDCDLCHTILLQGTKNDYEVAKFDESLEFLHPVDVKDKWKKYVCAECHRYLYE
jgi:hypothetical protein